MMHILEDLLHLWAFVNSLTSFQNTDTNECHEIFAMIFNQRCSVVLLSLGNSVISEVEFKSRVA